MNVDIEATLRRIAELERRAADLADQQDPAVRDEFDQVLTALVDLVRGLVLVVDNIQKES